MAPWCESGLPVCLPRRLHAARCTLCLWFHTARSSVRARVRCIQQQGRGHVERVCLLARPRTSWAALRLPASPRLRGLDGDGVRVCARPNEKGAQTDPATDAGEGRSQASREGRRRQADGPACADDVGSRTVDGLVAAVWGGAGRRRGMEEGGRTAMCRSMRPDRHPHAHGGGRRRIEHRCRQPGRRMLVKKHARTQRIETERRLLSALWPRPQRPTSSCQCAAPLTTISLGSAHSSPHPHTHSRYTLGDVTVPPQPCHSRSPPRLLAPTEPTMSGRPTIRKHSMTPASCWRSWPTRVTGRTCRPRRRWTSARLSTRATRQPSPSRAARPWSRAPLRRSSSVFSSCQVGSGSRGKSA